MAGDKNRAGVIERCFKCIKLLSERAVSINEIAEELGIHRRNAEYYLMAMSTVYSVIVVREHTYEAKHSLPTLYKLENFNK